MQRKWFPLSSIYATISIHAPVWVRTKSNTHHREWHFNPRTMWGAMQMPPSILNTHYYFNPRTRVGYDRAHCPACGLIGSHVVPNIPRVIELDNRTSSLTWKVHACCLTPIQSATIANLLTDLHDVISIHVPVWGATNATTDSRLEIAISIHAPVLVRLPYFHQGRIIISIHVPVWGTTERYRPACGLIGSHAVPNIPLAIGLDNRTSS